MLRKIATPAVLIAGALVLALVLASCAGAPKAKADGPLVDPALIGKWNVADQSMMQFEFTEDGKMLMGTAGGKQMFYCKAADGRGVYWSAMSTVIRMQAKLAYEFEGEKLILTLGGASIYELVRAQ